MVGGGANKRSAGPGSFSGAILLSLAILECQPHLLHLLTFTSLSQLGEVKVLPRPCASSVSPERGEVCIYDCRTRSRGDGKVRMSFPTRRVCISCWRASTTFVIAPLPLDYDRPKATFGDVGRKGKYWQSSQSRSFCSGFE